MKKVFMSLAVVALMLSAASCACNNNQPAEAEAPEATECCSDCDSCTKACCDSTKCAACDSTAVAE